MGHPGPRRYPYPGLPSRAILSSRPQAGHLPQAKETLTAALEETSAGDDKQRTVILGDLAAVEAAQHSPDAACDYAEQALEQLARTWYATGMDRVLDVRKSLQPGPIVNVSGAWTTVSTGGKRRSAPCSIEHLDPAR